MTAPLDLDALDSLLAKATPGPWAHRAKFPTEIAGDNGDGGLVCLARDSYETRLIIALVNAAPALVAELRAARDVVSCAKDLLDALDCEHPEFGYREMADLRATLSRAATGPSNG